jgi:hypothetical protein
VTLLAWSLAAALVLLAVVAALSTRVAALQRPARLGSYAGEALVVVLVVADLGLVLRADPADRPDSLVTHVGYALAAVGLVPVLTTRPAPVGQDAEAAAEAEPVSPWVLAVALLAVAVCVVRLVQTR